MRVMLDRLCAIRNDRTQTRLDNESGTCTGVIYRFAAAPSVRLFAIRNGVDHAAVAVHNLFNRPIVTFNDKILQTVMCLSSGRILSMSPWCWWFNDRALHFILQRSMRRFLRQKHRRIAVSAALAELRVLLPELDPFVVAYTSGV